ncbi:MAG TPA: hypothetical protein VM307_07465 [Egibacteraceae bacterium]|nr:hypothetical protein [Egibacteraceae bacterium]
MATAALLIVIAAGLIVVHYGFVRRWMLTWGASVEELGAALPGDEFVLDPRTGSTRAITIHAPLEAVWPWIAQMGQGRGGLYSYDWLENLFGCDIHSSDRILSNLQTVEVGDVIRLVKEGYPVDLSFEVAFVHPPRALVLRPRTTPEEAFAAGMAYTTWAFVLQAVNSGTTRLISRWRTDFKPTPAGYFWWKYGPVEAVNFVMERKMLKGLRRRAEHCATWRLMAEPTSADAQHPNPSAG